MAPQISIVVCTYNRQKFIGECLNCLAAQNLDPAQWEAIIIDNNSSDQTAEIVRDFMRDNPALPFRSVFEPNQGLSFARNRGIAEAGADIITYIDDDAEAVPAFAESILTFMLSHPDAAGVGGRVIPKYSESPEPRWMNNYLNGFVGRVDHGEPPRVFKGRMKYPIGCNMTYRKELMVQAGGFNNQLTFRGDDKHIYHAVARINDKVFYLPNALVYHNIDAHRLTFGSFRKLFLKTGNEEGIRVQTERGNAALLLKAIEFMAKFGVSLALWVLFTLKGQEIKGRYVMYSQWFTLWGFFRKRVVVR